MLPSPGVVVEVASVLPRIFGDVTLHVSQVDAIVESDRYPAALSPQPPMRWTASLAGWWWRSWWRTGPPSSPALGVPSTPWPRAQDKRGLGIHTEAMSDAAMESAPVRRGGQ